MLNTHILLYDNLGRIRCTLAPPTQFNGGTPTNGQLLSIAPDVAEHYLAGFGFRDNQCVCSEQSLNPSQDGPIVGPQGRARTTLDIPKYYLHGLPFSANSILCVAPPEPPPGSTYAYDSAFSSAFNSINAPGMFMIAMTPPAEVEEVIVPDPEPTIEPIMVKAVKMYWLMSWWHKLTRFFK